MEENFQMKGIQKKKKGIRKIGIRTRTLREKHEQCIILSIIGLLG